MTSRRSPAQPHWSHEQDFGPLFSAQTYQVNMETVIEWARRELLLSGLMTFTAEDVRQITAAKRPHWILSGRWFGLVFQNCPWFEYIEHVPSTRDEARGRQIMRYWLTEGGQAMRRELTHEHQNHKEE